MKNLTQVEWKKMIKNKAVKIAFVSCVIYMVVAISMTVHVEEYWKYDQTTGQCKTYHGYVAIKQKRKDMEKISYTLTSDKIAKIIEDVIQTKKEYNVKSILDLDDKTYYQHYALLDDVIDLISRSYSKAGEYDLNTIEKLKVTDASRFYENRWKITKRNLKQIPKGYGNINYAQKKTIRNSVTNLQIPLQYKYSYGWRRIFDNFYWINIVIILAILFVAGILFSMEYENEMILLVLATPNGKSKLLRAKIRSAMRFASCTVWGLNALFLAIMLMVYGRTGWNCMIQIQPANWLSVYNITFWKLYAYGVCMVWLASLCVIMITALLACRFRKTVHIVGISLLLLFVPKLVSQNVSKTVDNVLNMLPINAFNVEQEVKTLCTVNVFGEEYLRAYITPFFVILLCVFFWMSSIHKFKKIEA